MTLAALYHALMPDLRNMIYGYDKQTAVYPEPRCKNDVDPAVADLYEEQDEALFSELTDKKPQAWVTKLVGNHYYVNHQKPKQLKQRNKSGLSLLHCMLSKYMEDAKNERLKLVQSARCQAKDCKEKSEKSLCKACFDFLREEGEIELKNGDIRHLNSNDGRAPSQRNGRKGGKGGIQR